MKHLAAFGNTSTVLLTIHLMLAWGVFSIIHPVFLFASFDHVRDWTAMSIFATFYVPMWLGSLMVYAVASTLFFGKAQGMQKLWETLVPDTYDLYISSAIIQLITLWVLPSPYFAAHIVISVVATAYRVALEE